MLKRRTASAGFFTQIWDNRSIKSNFFKVNKINIKNKYDNTVENKLTTKDKNQITTLIKKEKSSLYIKPKHLSEFTISEEDHRNLVLKSGRKFSMHSMNEILKAMARKLKDIYFYSKKAFINYMAKAFKHELRDEERISNTEFKAKINSEIESSKIDKYLNSIETKAIRDPSLENRFKAKLASTLSPETANKFLQSLKRIIVKSDKLFISLFEDTSVSLSEKDIILKQAKSVYNCIKDGKEHCINEVNINVWQKYQNNSDTLGTKVNQLFCSNIGTSIIKTDDVWNKIRLQFACYYGEQMEQHWLSKLHINLDKTAKILQLKASSEFIADWINEHYLDSIKKIGSKLGVDVVNIE